jgi:hypothetical protein
MRILLSILITFIISFILTIIIIRSAPEYIEDEHGNYVPKIPINKPKNQSKKKK